MHRVIAVSGLRVPCEHDPRVYIESEPVDVPDSAYYRRRLDSGELLMATEGMPAAEPTTPSTAPASKRTKA